MPLVRPVPPAPARAPRLSRRGHGLWTRCYLVLADGPRAAESGSAVIRGRAQTQPRRDGSMNRLELEYSQRLELMRRTGQIARWDFQPEKLRLADRTFYEPDFRVVMPDGAIVFHETKGFMRDDAAVKIKVAAEQHPYRFVLVRKLRGLWDTAEV